MTGNVRGALRPMLETALPLAALALLLLVCCTPAARGTDLVVDPVPQNTTSCKYAHIRGNFRLEWWFLNETDEITFRFQLPGTGWSSIGFGTDMTNTDMVIGWMKNGNTPTVLDTFSRRQDEPPSDTSISGCTYDLRAVSMTTSNGVSTVVFTRKLDTGDHKCDAVIKKGEVLDVVYAWYSGSSSRLEEHRGSDSNHVRVEMATCLATFVVHSDDPVAVGWTWAGVGLAFGLLVLAGLALLACGVDVPFRPAGGARHKAHWMAALVAAVVVCAGVSWGVWSSWSAEVFYGAFFVLCFGVYLSTAHPRSLFYALHKHLCQGKGPSPGEVLLVLCYLLFNAYWAWQWFTTDAIRNSGDGIERSNRTLGHLAELNAALLLLPVTRTSVWSSLFGVPFERAVKYHRWVARVLLVGVTLHMLAWWLTWSRRGDFGKCLVAYSDPSCTGALMGDLAWLCGVVMGLTALEFVRRRFFEVFYYTHHLFLAFFFFAIYHSVLVGGYLVGYLLIGAALYLLDRLVRLWRGRFCRATLNSASVEFSEVTKLSVHADGFEHQPGQYCFVSVPGVSLLQWHPLSISSAPNSSGNFTFHVKDMGPGTWTGRLARLVKTSAGGPFDLLVDGPYGNPGLRWDEYSDLVLVAGGIGATPVVSVLEHLLNLASASDAGGPLRRVNFVWVVREPVLFRWFEDTLRRAVAPNARQVVFGVHLFVTGSQRVAKPSAPSAPSSIAMAEIASNPNAWASLSSSSGSGRSNSGEDGGAGGIGDNRETVVPVAPAEPAAETWPPFSLGRPNFSSLLSRLVTEGAKPQGSIDGGPRRIGMFVCGPKSLVDEAVRAGRSHHPDAVFDIHTEVFRL